MNLSEIKLIISARTAPFMTLAGLAADDLEDSICEGILLAGGMVASYGNPTDADCASVSNPVKLLLAIEYSWLEHLIDNLPLNDVTAGDVSEKLSQLIKQLERKLERIRKKLQKNYGIGLATITPKTVYLGFQEAYND